MLKSLVAEWLTPSGSRYRKPRDWADNLRPTITEKGPISGAPENLQSSIGRAQEALLKMQNREDGYWYSPLKADTTLESDTIMLLNFLGRGQSPKVRKLANHILKEQLPDGGWPIYKNGPAEISATVKAYWALKFAGHAPHEPRMVSAREKIRQLGGIHKVNTYTKFYMAVFGQYDWRGVPTIPPELMLFPNWFYFNLYEMSAWTRAIVVPLSIVWAHEPRIKCPSHAVLDELFPDSRRFAPLQEAHKSEGVFTWTNFFLLWDNGLKAIEGRGPHWIRSWSLRLAEDWMLQRLQASDGLGAIYPGIVNTVMAMKCLGYADSDPRLVSQLQALELMEHDGETREGPAGPTCRTASGKELPSCLELQPSLSPVWDTAISVIALAESGLERDHPALTRATEWLISEEIKIVGDWKVNNPEGSAAGWCFQFNNAFYPDIDDTAMVMLALRHVHLEEPLDVAREKACQRGLHWLLSMQSKNGGWAAFDKDNTKWVFTKVPFADHNAMIDPPTADITARVLEFLGYIGYDRSYPAVARAVRFLQAEQESDGSWYGRWNVNYIYGTWQVLRGLAAIDEDMTQPYIRKAADWLKSVQNADGGWGETCLTYADPAQKGQGPSTPSQTAWALMGLMAAGVYDESVERGVRHLLETQKEDGTWDETEYTGTGFPQVFYLEYTMYRVYFPLQALGNYMGATQLKRARGRARTLA